MGISFIVSRINFQFVQEGIAHEDGFHASAFEPVLLEGQQTTELVTAFAELADTPAAPGPKLGGHIKEGLQTGFFGGFCHVKVEGGRITDDNQIEVACSYEVVYPPDELIVVSDLAEGFINHRGPAACTLQQLTAGLHHFRAADAHELNMVILLA